MQVGLNKYELSTNELLALYKSSLSKTDKVTKEQMEMVALKKELVSRYLQQIPFNADSSERTKDTYQLVLQSINDDLLRGEFATKVLT